MIRIRTHNPYYQENNRLKKQIRRGLTRDRLTGDSERRYTGTIWIGSTIYSIHTPRDDVSETVSISD